MAVKRDSCTIGQLFISVKEGRGFAIEGACDLYCVMDVENQQLRSTTCPITSTIQPTWNEGYNFDITTPDARISIGVYAKTPSFAFGKRIGTVDIPLTLIGVNKSNEAPANKNSTLRSHVWVPLASNDNPSAQLRCELYYTAISEKKVGLEDFIVLRKLGQGAFGEVLLVRKKDTGSLYAMKVCEQDRIIDMDVVDLALSEHNLIKSFNHPFVVSLKFSFKTKHRLYLIMDYIAGGELFYHIVEQRVFSEHVVRFYAAQLVLALGFLHEHNVMYRDLKPENLLLDVKGYICICDFGLSKEQPPSEKAYTMCGSTEYMAPEILKGKGYGKEVDWWALGALIYEMLTGKCLFAGATTTDVHKNILYGSIPFPDIMSKNAMSLLISLLKKDPAKRLGYGPKGTEDIKAHPFFAGVDWKLLLHKEIEPPFKPELGGETDLKYFDPDCTESKPDIPYSPRVDTFDKNFGDFSYVAPAEVFKAHMGTQCLRGNSSRKLKVDRAHSAFLLKSVPKGRKPLTITVPGGDHDRSPQPTPSPTSPTAIAPSPGTNVLRRPFSLPDQVCGSPLQHSVKLSQSSTIGHGLARVMLSDRDEDILSPHEGLQRSPRLDLAPKPIAFEEVVEEDSDDSGISPRKERPLAKSMPFGASQGKSPHKDEKKLRKSMKDMFSKIFSKKSR